MGYTKQFHVPAGAAQLPVSLTIGSTANGFISPVRETLGDINPGPLLLPPPGEGPKPPGRWEMTRFFLPVFIVLLNPSGTPPTLAYLTLVLKTETGTVALVSVFPLPLTAIGAGGPAAGTVYGSSFLGADLTNPTPVWCTQSLELLYNVSFDQSVAGNSFLGLAAALSPPANSTSQLLDKSMKGAIDYEAV